MFAFENFAHAFHRHLTKVITARPPTELSYDSLMPKYDQFLVIDIMTHSSYPTNF